MCVVINIHGVLNVYEFLLFGEWLSLASSEVTP